MNADTADRASSGARGPEQRGDRVTDTNENHSFPAQDGEQASSHTEAKKLSFCGICVALRVPRWWRGPTAGTAQTTQSEMPPQVPRLSFPPIASSHGHDPPQVAGPSSFGKFSEENISEVLESLNGKLQGAGMNMADCLARGFEFGNLTEERATAVQRVSNCIGLVLGTSLGTGTPKDIPKLLPIAFQTCLAFALHRIASTNLNNDTDQNSSRAESPTKQTIIADIGDIMLAAGCNAARDDLSSKIASEFEEKITSLVELAVRLQTMLKKASDFKVFIARSGEKFDGAKFEDENADNTEGVITQGALVLCVTSIGLIKQVPSEMGQEEKVVLKANVLLDSFLG